MSLRVGTTYACFDVFQCGYWSTIPTPLKKNGEPPTEQEFLAKYCKTHLEPKAVRKSDPFLFTKEW